MKKYIHIIVPVAAVLACSLFIFTTFDKKVNDIFLRAIPSLTENPSVLLVKIDDPSIEKVGIFPWTRDIMADAIVFLREMGADTVVFDLSYLDKSPVKVDPVYVNEELPGYIEYGFKQINDNTAQVLDAFARHQLGASDVPSAKKQLEESNKQIKDSLGASIAYVARDVDAYFAKTLKFFGKSYLTLTMISSDIIIGSKNQTFDMTAYDVPYLEDHIALKNVTAKNDTLTPELIGITPALKQLLVNAEGAGFVNADPDNDGYRRRVNLLLKYNGKYYGQLVLVPLLQRLGNPAIEVSNQFIILRKAHVGKKVMDIKIPRGEDGSVIVKWPKKEFKDYNSITAWDLIRNDRVEKAVVSNLTAMRDAGFFNYWDGDTPLDKYGNANYVKEALYDGEKADQGITFATYREFRADFINATDSFLNGNSERQILDSVDEADTATREYIKDIFEKTRKQFADLKTIREKTAQKAVGAFCIVGTSATSTTDEGLTTFQERFPNVGLHATIANMILSDEFLDDTPWYVPVIIAFILAIALGFASKHLDTKQSMIAGLSTLALSVAALLLFFIVTHRYVGVVVPFASVTATFITLSAISFLTTIREKSFLRSAFSRYLSPAVINEIINDPSKLNLGGEKREMTAIFTDVRGFSTISEKLDPADLVNLLNMYLTEMSNIVLENRGTIDKYEGDAIIAFFGAPIHMDEHATLACRTAIRMKKSEALLNERIAAENLSPSPIFTRIGINTGDMIVGNMGTPNKMDYTIMGNAVNLAARLEGVNKQYNTRGILISEHTRGKIYDEFLVRRLDRVRVVGVNTPLRLYELLDELADASDEARELVRVWEEAIDLYERKDFAAAKASFAKIAASDPGDLVAPLYVSRCDGFIANPPAGDWDGVFNLTQK